MVLLTRSQVLELQLTHRSVKDGYCSACCTRFPCATFELTCDWLELYNHAQRNHPSRLTNA